MLIIPDVSSPHIGQKHVALDPVSPSWTLESNLDMDEKACHSYRISSQSCNCCVFYTPQTHCFFEGMSWKVLLVAMENNCRFDAGQYKELTGITFLQAHCQVIASALISFGNKELPHFLPRHLKNPNSTPPIHIKHLNKMILCHLEFLHRYFQCRWATLDM